jgi:sulfite reductase alpha subunit-like flavoprotein
VKKLFDGGKIYICGSLKMGNDVSIILEQKIREYIREHEMGMTYEAAK